MMFSYFAYAAAFIPPDGVEAPYMDAGLVAIALALAPFVFVVIGFVSRNPTAAKHTLRAMGLLLALGLAVGLIAPVLGAAAGFGVGTALVLNRPEADNVVRNRMIGVAMAVSYTLLLLVIAPAAGILTGALLPPIMVGFADEYTAWRAARPT